MKKPINSLYDKNMMFDSLSSKSIWVMGFEDDDLYLFYNQFVELEQDPSVQVIPIYISSYGGLTDNAFAMRDLIKSSTKTVATIAIGKAMSSGCILLACGKKGLRFMSNDCSVMIHQVSSGISGKTSDVFSSAIFLKNSNELMIKNLSADTGTPAEKFKKLIKDNDNADLFLNSADCINLGIVDYTGIPRILIGQTAMTISLNKPEGANTENATKPDKTKKAKKGKKK